MAVFREAPTCLKCGELIKGIYAKHQTSFVGDNFIKWDYEGHVCKVKSEKKYTEHDATNIWNAGRNYQMGEQSEYNGGGENEYPNYTDFIKTLNTSGIAVPIPAIKEDTGWDECFTNVPVRIHPNTEEWLKENYTLTPIPQRGITINKK